jgi:nitronate monooxygenase
MRMEWKTRITEMCGCRYPIIQGAFAGFGKSTLAAPVSEAGGFGIITAHALGSAKKLRQDIQNGKMITDNPFGVNFTILPSLFPEEYYEKMVEVVIDEGIKTVFTSAYKAKKIGDRVHEAGLNWIHKVATMKHALAAEKHGADAVVIVGLEGTGFKNPLQNTTLINMVMANRLLKIPFIAAGGIGDARGFLAALALGAQGVYVGTGFMATKECPISEGVKHKLIEQSSFDPDLYLKLYHHQLKESVCGSMTVGVITMSHTVQEFISTLIDQAEKTVRDWGFTGKVFSTY